MSDDKAPSADALIDQLSAIEVKIHTSVIDNARRQRIHELVREFTDKLNKEGACMVLSLVRHERVALAVWAGGMSCDDRLQEIAGVMAPIQTESIATWLTRLSQPQASAQVDDAPRQPGEDA